VEQNFGALSLLPPLIAIGLAIWTKQVILSLFIGVAVGAFVFNNYAVLPAFFDLIERIVAQMTDDWQARVLIFTCLLGGIIGLVQKSGGFRSFGDWAGKRVKSRKGAQVLTWLAGVVIFFDDYFNTLTVGSVMRPLTDRYRVSREKLAYIVDSTAAPVCILIPISTWVAYVVSLIAAEFSNAGIDTSPFLAYITSIPYNLYAIAAVVMVVMIAATDLEFGPMAKAEKRAMLTGDVSRPGVTEVPGQDIALLKPAEKGSASDMFLPIITLVAVTIIGILYTGGFFDGASFQEAVGDADSATALLYATLLANAVAVVWYAARKVVPVIESMEAIATGIKSMVPALCILILAWAIGGVSSDLGTGAYVAEIVGSTLPGWSIPVILFIVACFIAFSTGTSWGTFAIVMPLAVPIGLQTHADLLVVIGAVLAGGIFGDHCSPISDTTVLSSTGSACNHIDHVTTQIPYAVVAAACAAVGFLVAGFVPNAILAVVVTLGLLFAVAWYLHRRGEVLPEIKAKKAATH